MSLLSILLLPTLLGFSEAPARGVDTSALGPDSGIHEAPSQHIQDSSDTEGADSQTKKAAPKKAAPKKAAQEERLAKQADALVGCVRRRALPNGITTGQRALVFGVIRNIRVGRHDAAQAMWEQFLAQVSTSRMPVDTDAVVQFVLRESYLANNEELRIHADKVRYLEAQKQGIRDHMEHLRNERSKLSGEQTARVKGLELRPYAVGRRPIRFTAARTMSKEALEHEAKVMMSDFATAADMSALAMAELQDLMQKQNQALSAMSGIMKMMHDTTKSVIDNIR